jgi:hypothetical protein
MIGTGFDFTSRAGGCCDAGSGGRGVGWSRGPKWRRGLAVDLAGEVGKELVVEAAARAGALREVVLCEEKLDAEVVETVAMAMEALDGQVVVETNRDKRQAELEHELLFDRSEEHGCCAFSLEANGKL